MTGISWLAEVFSHLVQLIHGGPLGKHIVHRDFVQRRHVLKGMQKIHYDLRFRRKPSLVQSRNQKPHRTAAKLQIPACADGQLNG